MTTASLNTVALATAVPEAVVLKVARQLVGARRNVFVDVPGRAGSWVFGEEAGDRQLVITLDIQADTFALRRDAIRRLADWCDLAGPTELIIDDEPDRYHLATLSATADVAEWLNYAADLDLPFTVGPYALATVLSTGNLVIAGASPQGGTFDLADTIEALPVFTITPTNGTITAFTLEVSDVSIDYATLIADDQTVTVSAVTQTVTTGDNVDVDITGAFDPLTVSMATVSGDFPTLIPGPNPWTFAWTGTATAITIVATWRERFR